jgi:phage regulator Rha-like protein
MTTNALVFAIKQQPMTDTLIISEATGVQHKNLLELVRSYIDDLQEFGRVAFQTQPFATEGGMQTREVAVLNEEQTTLLITYMRNSEKVREFKKAIVKAFFEMRKTINGIKIATTDKREAYKDMMNALVEQRQFLGKNTESRHFIIENKLCNWAVTKSFIGIDESQMNLEELQLLMFARKTNESLILAGLEYDERKHHLAYAVEHRRRKLAKLMAA